MKKIILLLMIVSVKGFAQPNYQFYKATIQAGLYYKAIPASASTLDSAVYVDRTTGDFQVRKMPSAQNIATSNLSADADYTHNFHGFNQTLDSIGNLYIFTKGVKFGVKQGTSIAFLANESLPMLIRSATIKSDASADSVTNTIQAGANNNTLVIRSANATTGAIASIELRNANGTNHTGRVDVYADTVALKALPVTTADSQLVVGPHQASTNTNTIYKMPLQKFLNGTTTHDFGTIANNSSATTTVSVTGAADGDFVVVTKPIANGWSNGESYTAWVSAADQVTVRQNNNSGGSAGFGSQTINVKVIKQ